MRFIACSLTKVSRSLFILFLAFAASLAFAPSAYANQGLQATFYDNQTGQGNQYNNAPPIPPTTPVVASIPVATVDQDFDQYPMGGLPQDDFVVKYEGFITASETRTAQLRCLADDGCIVIINGQTIINEWYDKGASGEVSSYQTIGGQSLPFVVWYYENGGGASVLLQWKSEDSDWTVIPESVFSTIARTPAAPAGPTEEELQAQEAARIEAELQAAIAEAARIQAEEDARIAEEERLKAAEAARIAEETRIKAEADRLKAEEDARIAEAARLRAEAARIQAEEDARIAEQKRLKAEEEARIAEEERLKAEEDARIAEAERLKAEADRIKAEEDARIAEADRLKAEEEARIAEADRLKAEAEAAIAEADRLKAEEDARVQEEKRLAAEEAAAIAEAARLKAEADKPKEEQVQATVAALIADALATGEPITAAGLAESGVTLEDLPAETPIELENGVIITAEIAIDIQLLEDAAAFVSELFSDPLAAFSALGSVGADLTPEARARSEKVVLSAIIAGNIATQAAATAAGVAAYRRNP